MIAFVVFATYVTVPYYAIAPGSAIDTAQFVTVDGARSHPAEGKILLTTVSLGKVTLWEAIEGWLDPGVDVVQERVIIGDRDIDEQQLREENLQLMADSRQKAIGVALEQLGYDAVTGAGAEIVGIVAGTPAEGLVAVGDTILAVDGLPIQLDIDAIRAISGRSPGDSARLDVQAPDGTVRSVEVSFVARTDDPSRAFLGVELTTKSLSFDVPFEIDVRSEQIGGPSAGLAFTLELIDLLTEGELTGGEIVATTGTIELDGSVGEVGGVAQKTLAVKRAGATLFLVPSGELEIARRFAGDDLRVEPADSITDALAVLATVGGNGLALPDLGSERASS